MVGDVADVTIVLTPPYQDLTFMTALSEDRADGLVDFIASDLQGTVLDIGCGWAELLLRVVAAAPECRGIGVDLEADSIKHGRRVADSRGLTDRITLIEGDAKKSGPEHAEAVICIGASHVWNPPSEVNQPLNYTRALAAIRARVGRGARVIYGEAVWSASPTPAAAAPLGGRLDQLVSFAELIEIAVEVGFMPVAFHETNGDEWDEFESGYSASYATWLAEHDPDHPDAAEVRALAGAQRDRNLRGYRGIMGMAYLQLLAV